MKTNESRNSILEDILREDGASIQTTYTIITDDTSISKYSLLDLLGARDSMLTAHGKEILTLMESDDAPCKELYLKLKWNIVAFLTVQDTFDGAIYNTDDVLGIGLKNYFYYESLHLLREYVYCGFNNCLSAAQHLLRTVVEFNIKQLYFEKICTKGCSYQPVLKYLQDGVSPSIVSMTNKALDDYNLARPLKKSVSSLYSRLSKMSSHAYIPIYSTRSSGKMQHEYSMDSVVFWSDLYVVLSQILWMYYFCHPQLFNPKDIVKKFGFSPPCGCFITENQHIAIKKSLCYSDYEMFKSLASGSDKIIYLNALYNSCDNLSCEQIQNTWDENLGELPKNTNVAFCAVLAELHAIQEILASSIAYKDRKGQEMKTTNIDSKTLSAVVTYNWIMKNYKNLQ